MAEIIIPAVALGAMYIVSNQKKGKTIEKFENPRRSVPEGMLPTGMPTKPTQNYPVQK